MCMLGDGIKRMDVPREKAIRASKRFSGTYTGLALAPTTLFKATAFTNTTFIEDGARKTTRYRIGHNYSTVKPTKAPKGRYGQDGNGRGFWAYNKGHARTDIGEKTLTVLLWGRVVQHQFGYRAEHMRIIRQAIPQ